MAPTTVGRFKWWIRVLLALLCLVLLALAWGTYRFTGHNEILVDEDGLKYVDFSGLGGSRRWGDLAEPPLSAPLRSARLAVDGYRREFDYFVPAGARAGAPLVFVLHGSRMSAAQMRATTAYEFDLLADQHGFVVVYPQGFDGGWNDLRNQSPHTAKRLDIDDVAFFRAVLSHLHERHGTDPEGAFFFGLSNGGQMIYRVMLAEPAMVKAGAIIAANLPRQEQSPLPYDAPRGVPVMFVHGTADTIAPYEGGVARIPLLMNFGPVNSVADSVQFWLDAARQAGEPRRQHIDRADDDTSIDLMIWDQPGRPEVRFYRVNGGGHTLPSDRGGTPIGATSRDMNTVREAWAFFARHRDRRRGG